MNTERYQIYSRYERFWHWAQAAIVLAMLATGLAIHAPDGFGLIPFPTAVLVHNVLGFVLLGNAVLGLFYYVVTGSIRQYMPEPRDVVTLAVRQAWFYLDGIFRNEPHPLEKQPERRLNPLQQITYLAILNVLLPLQMATGLAMWGTQHSELIQAAGGLPVLAMVHTLGAWLFAAFVVMHAYLITTGPTPLTHLRAMIWGYEEAPFHKEEARHISPREEARHALPS